MEQNDIVPTAYPRDEETVTGQENTSIEDQLVALMDRYETPIYAYLLSILRDRDVALDCAQDTFLRAYEALRRRKSINAAWLYTVARNRAVDEFRRNKHMQRNEGQLQDVPSGHASVDSALEVQAVMDRLPPMDREVLYLFEVAGFTTDEIGSMLGVRGVAVRKRLTRARQRFRALYSPEPGEGNKLEARWP